MDGKAIIKKLEEHDIRFDGVDERFKGVDERFDSIDERFNNIDERFNGIDKRLDSIDERFDSVDERFKGVDERFDVMARKLVEHDQRFDRLENKIDISINGLREEMLRGQDEMLTILHRLDQERIVTFNWIKRVEEQGEKNTKDIADIKRFLKMS